MLLPESDFHFTYSFREFRDFFHFYTQKKSKFTIKISHQKIKTISLSNKLSVVLFLHEKNFKLENMLTKIFVKVVEHFK